MRVLSPSILTQNYNSICKETPIIIRENKLTTIALLALSTLVIFSQTKLFKDICRSFQSKPNAHKLSRLLENPQLNLSRSKDYMPIIKLFLGLKTPYALLLHLKKSNNANVQRFVVLSLRKLGKTDEALPILLDMKNNSEALFRLNTAELLGEIGSGKFYNDEGEVIKSVPANKADVEKTYSALIEMLNDFDATVRIAAAKALGEVIKSDVEYCGDKVFSALVEKTKDTDPRVRCAAVQSLGEIEREKSCDVLIGMRGDEEKSVQNAIAKILEERSVGRTYSEKAFNALKEMSCNPHCLVRPAIAKLLLKTGTLGAYNVLMEMKKDKSVDVRCSVAQALGRVVTNNEYDSNEALMEMSKDPEERVQYAVITALVERGTSVDTGLNKGAALGAYNALERIKESLDPWGESAMLKVIGETESTEVVCDALIKRIEDENLDLRFAVGKALASMNPESSYFRKAFDALVRMKSDREGRIRDLVSSTLTNLSTKGAYAEEALVVLAEIESEKAGTSATKTVTPERGLSRRLSSSFKGLAPSSSKKRKKEETVQAQSSSIEAPNRYNDKAYLALIKMKEDPNLDQVRCEVTDSLVTKKFATLADPMEERGNQLLLECTALEALYKTAPDPTSLYLEIVARSKDINFIIRYFTATVLERIASKEALETLISMRGDKHEDVRCSVTSSLAEIGTENACKALVEMENDESEDVRCSVKEAQNMIETKKTSDALTALRTVDEERNLDTVIEMRKFHHSKVRISIAEALGESSSSEKKATEALLDMLKDLNLDVQCAAAKSLGKLGSREALKALIEIKEKNKDTLPTGMEESIQRIELILFLNRLKEESSS
jgi:HEAT repeat protein